MCEKYSVDDKPCGDYIMRKAKPGEIIMEKEYGAKEQIREDKLDGKAINIMGMEKIKVAGPTGIFMIDGERKGFIDGEEMTEEEYYRRTEKRGS